LKTGWSSDEEDTKKANRSRSDMQSSKKDINGPHSMLGSYTNNNYDSDDLSDCEELFHGFTAPVSNNKSGNRASKNASRTLSTSQSTNSTINSAINSSNSNSGRGALRGIQDLSGAGLGLGLKPGQTVRVKAGGHSRTGAGERMRK